jgi:UDP-N-acetylglucosamine 2-epimerase (non-hydrolysing)
MAEDRMKQIKVLIIIGTRPEALKLAPVILAAKKDRRFRAYVCLTGQHREMVAPVLEHFKISPDFNFNLMKKNQSLHEITSGVLSHMADLLKTLKPHAVMVQGDTTSAMGAALQSFYDKVPVIHVEAGLRSFDPAEPFPEEMNRILISRVADFHFAPTLEAKKNLLRENIPSSKILVSGNTIVDALQRVANTADWKRSIEKINGRILLVTAHRRENWGKPLRAICLALKALTVKYPDVQVIYPVHLNPHVHNTVFEELGNSPRIHLVAPMPYMEFLKNIQNSYLIITDSGGVQEEAPSFGKPVLILRRVSERLEGVRSGIAKLVGVSKKQIVREVSRLLDNPKAYKKMVGRKNPYGNGKASRKILNFIAGQLRNSKINDKSKPD